MTESTPPTTVEVPADVPFICEACVESIKHPSSDMVLALLNDEGDAQLFCRSCTKGWGDTTLDYFPIGFYELSPMPRDKWPKNPHPTKKRKTAQATKQ
jgi:hypothetical protein